jgi:hypothetical protein
MNHFHPSGGIANTMTPMMKAATNPDILTNLNFNEAAPMIMHARRASVNISRSIMMPLRPRSQSDNPILTLDNTFVEQRENRQKSAAENG